MEAQRERRGMNKEKAMHMTGRMEQTWFAIEEILLSCVGWLPYFMADVLLSRICGDKMSSVLGTVPKTFDFLISFTLSLSASFVDVIPVTLKSA